VIEQGVGSKLFRDPSCGPLSLLLSVAEIGAERAENRVSGSGAVSGRGKMRWRRSAEREVAEPSGVWRLKGKI